MLVSGSELPFQVAATPNIDFSGVSCPKGRQEMARVLAFAF